MSSSQNQIVRLVASPEVVQNASVGSMCPIDNLTEGLFQVYGEAAYAPARRARVAKQRSLPR